MKKFDIRAICNAYESGYGDGYDRKDRENPMELYSDESKGWNYGYSQGENKRRRHDAKSETQSKQ